MKLRLGISLRRCLLMAMAAVSVTIGTYSAHGETINLGYADSRETICDMSDITAESKGTYYIDELSNKDMDMTGHVNLSLGVAKDTTYTGNITVADGAAYRVGGGTGVLTIDTVLSGTHDLEVDAHGKSGGKVILNQATDLNGKVYICGYNSGWGSASGDMTLQLNVDNAFSANTNVRVVHNGTLDINGTTQTLGSFYLPGAGNGIIDSSEDFSGHLTLTIADSANTTQQSSINVGHLTLNMQDAYALTAKGAIYTDTLTKTGSESLTLSYDTNQDGVSHFFRNLHVEEGLVWTNAHLDTVETLRISDGAIADIKDFSVGGEVQVLSGTGTLRTSNKSGSDGDTNAPSDGDSVADLNGVDVAKGATLLITDYESGFAVTFDATKTQSINQSGGTIQIENYTVNMSGLANGGTQTIGGTVEVIGASGMLLTATENDLTTTRAFDTVKIADGKTLLLRARAGATTTWQFSNLQGGTVDRQAVYGYMGTSKIKISPASGTEQSQVTSVINGDMSMEIAGNAKLSAANAYTGGTTVTGGTLTTANASALGTGGLALNNNALVMESNLSLGGAMSADGGSVDMGGYMLSLNAAGNTLANTTLNNGTVYVGSGMDLSLSGTITMSGASYSVAGTVNVADGTIFALSLSDFENKSLTLSAGGGSFTALSAANFTVNDIAASEYGLSVSQDGASITLTYANTKDYTWSAGTGTWNTTDANWKRPENADNETYGNDGNVTFASNDSNTEVTVAEGASAVNMTVAGDYTFEGEGVSVTHDLKVQKSGTATFDGAAPTVGGDVAVADGGTLALENVTGATVTGSVATEGTGKLSMTASSLTVNSDSVIGNVTVGAGASTLTAGGEADIRVDNLTVQNGATLSSNKLTVSGMQLTDGAIANSNAADLVMSDTISGKGSVSASEVDFVAGGEATLATGAELKLTATGKVLASGGKMTLESGAVLDMTGTGLNGSSHEGNITNILNSVQGAGTLKLATTGDATPAELTGSADVHTNVEVDGMLNLNAWRSVNSVVTLHEDASLTTKGELRVQSTAVVDVNGGALEAQGGIKLGHSTAENTGTLKLTDGTVTTTSIGAVAAHANNNLIMNGGTLEFTQNDTAAIGAGITTELNAGTLKAAASSWHVDRALELGDVTLDVASGKEIVFNGGLTNTADTTLKVTGGGTLKVNGNAADINGVLNVTDTGKLVLNNASLNLSATYHKVNHIKVEGTSAINIKGSTTSNSVMHMNGLAVHALNSQDGSLSNLTKFEDNGSTVYAAGASSENRAVISNAMIDIAKGTTFDLTNAVVLDTSRITDDSAYFNATDVQLDVTIGTNAVITPTVFSSGITLQPMGSSVESKTMTAEVNDPVLSISSTLMDSVCVSGSGITINLTGLNEGELKNYKYVSLTFNSIGKTEATFMTDTNLTVVSGCDSLSTSVYYNSMERSGEVKTLYVEVLTYEDAVPEPTTATLSLLALVGLMARRRRK